jgi:hypothetical protein
MGFVNQSWADGMQSYWFGSDGCFQTSICAAGGGGNVECEDIYGHWSEPACGTIDVSETDGGTETLMVQSAGANQVTINGNDYGLSGGGPPDGGYQPPWYCVTDGGMTVPCTPTDTCTQHGTGQKGTFYLCPNNSGNNPPPPPLSCGPGEKSGTSWLYCCVGSP